MLLYCIRIFKFKKEVGITTKSKETSSQLEPVMQLYHASASNDYTVSSNTCTKLTKHSLAHLKDLIPSCFGWYHLNIIISDQIGINFL